MQRRRRRSLTALEATIMSPSTARIHSANMAPQPRTLPPSTSPPRTALTDGSPLQGTVIDTPSFQALPLSFPIPSSFQPPRTTPLVPPLLSPSFPPPLVRSHSLVSSRGRQIKLHEHSIHLKPTSPPPPTSGSPRLRAPSPPPSSAPAPSLPPSSPLSSPAAVYHLHCWCLWQLRAEYLLGEVRRKLKKYSTARTTPSTPPLAVDPSLPPPLTLPLAGDGDLHITPRKGGWKRGLEREMKEAVVDEEEHKWTSPFPAALPSPTASPASLPVAPALSPSASLASVTSAIPAHHTSLTLDLIAVLCTTLTSLTVPPSSLALPFFTALAQCLLLPLPPPLSALTPSHYDAPHSFNYDTDAAVVNGVWHPPPNRIAIFYTEADAVDSPPPPPVKPLKPSHKKKPGGVKGKIGAHVKGKSHRKMLKAEPEQLLPHLVGLTPHATRAGRMAERAKKEEQREKSRPEGLRLPAGPHVQNAQARARKKLKTELISAAAEEHNGDAIDRAIQV